MKGEESSDQELKFTSFVNERDLLKEKLHEYSKATKFEQLMLHFVLQYHIQETLFDRTLKIAFENQLYQNQHSQGRHSHDVTLTQALGIIADKMGIVEQQLMIPLFEQN